MNTDFPLISFKLYSVVLIAEWYSKQGGIFLKLRKSVSFQITVNNYHFNI